MDEKTLLSITAITFFIFGLTLGFLPMYIASNNCVCQSGEQE